MPANKYALIRYRVIDECLTNRFRSYPSKEDIRAACEDALYGSQDARVSISTIEKDMHAMRNDISLGYEAPIAYHKYHKGYYYTEEGYTIKKIPLGREDIDALQFAAMTLYQFRDIPIFKAYEQAIEKVRESVALSSDSQDSTYLRHMLFEESVDEAGKQYLVPLLKAIREKRWVTMVYGSYKSESTKEYRIAPYLLKEYRRAWYVVGHDSAAEKVKTFGLERIRDLVVSEETYSVIDDFDAEEYFAHSVGITHFDTAPKKVRISVQRPLSEYIIANPFHRSQREVKSDSASVELEMEVIISHELVNELLSWAPHIHILAPAELRERYLDRLEGAMALHSPEKNVGRK